MQEISNPAQPRPEQHRITDLWPIATIGLTLLMLATDITGLAGIVSRSALEFGSEPLLQLARGTIGGFDRTILLLMSQSLRVEEFVAHVFPQIDGEARWNLMLMGGFGLDIIPGTLGMLRLMVFPNRDNEPVSIG